MEFLQWPCPTWKIFLFPFEKEKIIIYFFIYFHIKIVWRLHFGKFKKKFQKREAGKKVSSIPLRSFQQENRQTSRHNTARKKKRLSHAWLLPMPTLYNDRSKSLYTATFLFSALDLIESSSFAVRKKERSLLCRPSFCFVLFIFTIGRHWQREPTFFLYTNAQIVLSFPAEH
jgi:hypothetical protein